MATCLFHVGMPKTGTSSIQDSLYFALDDPGFRYLGLGHMNALPYLESVFGDRLEGFWYFRMRGYSSTRLRLMRRTNEWRLRRALRLALRRGQTPIISAERCWVWPMPVLERFRDFLAAEGFTVRVVAYVRPIKSWLESVFQQNVKFVQAGADPARAMFPPSTELISRSSLRLEILEGVFGGPNLVVRPFTRSALVGGCAVLDFCATAGIRFDPSAVIRSNESLSADAVRFLYAHGRFGPPAKRSSFLRTMMLVRSLETLSGDPFRFHSAVFAPVADVIDADVMALRDRWGIDLSEDLRAADGGACVREEADLFRYSRASLEWLAEASGSRPIAACEGEAAAREIAAQVERIRRRPAWRDVRWLLAGKIRTEARWLRHGD